MSHETYAFDPLPTSVAAPGEFVFAAMGLAHGHIIGLTDELVKAGATLKSIYDEDPEKLADFVARFPQATVAGSEEEILADDEVRLVASAGIPSERAPLGIRVMRSGKDYVVDKAPMTSLDQLAEVRRAIAETGRKYAVYYGERVHSEAAILAGQLIERGAIGRVLQVACFGPHRLGEGRPDWFFDPARYGGILCDIGSHNFEQMLFFTGATSGRIASATVANYAHPETPGLEDFGDAHLVLDNGATGYVRVDWFTPEGLGTWGDGRTLLLGTEGYIELRKNINIGTDDGPGQVFLVNGEGQQRFDARGMTGFPFFGRLIRDCIDRTETAMTQEHALMAAQLSLEAQSRAEVLAA